MSKEKIEKLEPVCEGCEDGACNIDFDTPTSYEEAYNSLKIEYERLEQGLDHADKLLKQKENYIEYLYSELIQNSKSANIALKTVKTIKNMIEVLDDTLQYTTELESQLKKEKRKNEKESYGGYYE